LAFESAPGPCGKLDLVFGAGFFGVLFEGMLDQFVDQFTERDAAGFAEFDMRADGKAGEAQGRRRSLRREERT